MQQRRFGHWLHVTTVRAAPVHAGSSGAIHLARRVAAGDATVPGMRVPLCLVLAACGSSGHEAARVPGGTVPTAPIVAAAGAPEFGSSPASLPRWTWEDYERETLPYAQHIARLTQPHPRATATARYGINLVSGAGNASWVLDGDATGGYWLAVDLDHDGDLADESIWPMPPGDDGWRVEVTAPRTTGAPLRYQVGFDGESVVGYHDAVRAGSAALPGGTLRFAIACPFADCANAEWVRVGFDLDGDGSVDLESKGSYERFRLGDDGLVAFGQAYDVRVSADGAQLELRPAAPREPRPTLAVGTKAPRLAFDGFDLAAQRGQVVLIDFFSAGCPHCIEDLPWLDALHAARVDAGLRIVTVAVESAPPRAAQWPTTVEDAAGPISTRYRVDAYPSYFVLDRDGIIVCARCLHADAERALDRLLAR